jgi:LmbE family N-acetylglucosaminyl deacetylase
MIDTSIPERVLVITAHPDDVDFGAAGSVACWTDAGAHVTYCIVTDGDAGGSDESVPRTTMAEIRRREQCVAAKVVGVERVLFLGYPDGRVEATLGLRRDLSRVIRDVRPTRVLAPSPERNYRRIYASHPDHVAVGEAALAAVYPDARNPFAHPELLDEGFAPWTAGELYLMAAPETDTYVDITDTVERKIEALRSHVSQLPDPDGIETRLRTWGAATAEGAGMPFGRLAEAFLRIETG